MEQYFIAETQRSNCRVAQRQWSPAVATDLDEAKKAAEDAQCFQGTSVWVGKKTELGVLAIAVKDDGDEWYGFFQNVAL